MATEVDSKVLDPAEAKWSPTVRLLDVNGRVFTYDGEIYRGIYPSRADFVRSLFSRGVIDELVDQGLLVDTQLTDRRLEGFGLVLKHERLDVLAKPTEWSLVTYKEAAKLYLEILRVLLKYDLTLHDGHPSNISLAPGGRVIWHDLGSIVEGDLRDRTPNDSKLAFFKSYQTSGGLRQFCDSFYYPLKLHRHVRHYALLQSLGMYCSKEAYHRLRYPRLSRLIEAATGSDGTSAGRLGRLIYRIWFKSGYVAWRQLLWGMARLGRGHRGLQMEGLLSDLESAIDAVPVSYADTTWGDYYSSSTAKNFGVPNDNRQKKVLEILEAVKPATVLDIGANEGLFSHLAYKHAHSVFSLDYDETAVAKHANLLLNRNRNERIYPLIVNMVNAPDFERFRAHTVLAMALTHHLRLGQGYSFDFIAGKLSSVAENVLLTEFMPNGLGGLKKSPDPLPADYTLDSFVSALRSFFSQVSVVDYERRASQSPRILVYCVK